MPHRRLLGDFFRSPIALAGGVIAGLSVVLILTLMVVETLIGESNPYLGLITFLILPMAMFVGFVLIFIGTRRQKRKSTALADSGAARTEYPILDFNSKRLRVAGLTLIGSVAFGIVLVAGISAKSIHYLESTEFCGTACHVMEPEFATYQNSPHSRIKCSECHVGSGTQHFIRAKVSGLRQVVALVLNTYSRPIPTPVHDLRPAQDICEHCHWPTKFIGNRTSTKVRFRADSANTRTASVMVHYIGGRTLQKSTGAHWHVDPDIKLRYRSDRTREHVAEIEMTLEDGSVKTFTRDGPVEEAEDWKEMDCVDCHNRPTHIYWSPDHAVDQALERGAMTRDLPFVKREALRLLEAEYSDKETGTRQITEGLLEFYANEYPEIAANRAADVEAAADVASRLYSTFIWPEMNVGWNPYPNHLGHEDFEGGCFRCHTPEMKSASGESISQNCGLCHAIVAWDDVPETMIPMVRDRLEHIGE